ncbi:sodium-dependent lysophosphatidylcholine symporter 1 [Cheilinus undulatus]|uniref:sodium-dependent lysophosphatidylcholine symporter 1 n=1 Tax=Cheilinus undulatus TaxID=241271 RepID=UPI001BD42E60|nr:sodium-dependent lysophosphatidylcholine symporter 1 [Cheilinus undulatus]
MNRLKNFKDEVRTLKSQIFKQNTESGSSQRGSGGIPLARKLCYAAGGVPYQVTSVAVGVSMQIFLLDVVQMEAYYVSIILFVSRAWDAVTDPLVGYLVTRSEWTPIGKLTPWLVLSTPFAVFSYLLMWFVPRGSMSQGLMALWFITVTCLFESLMSCYNVPFLSLNMFLGGDHRDRDSATAYRMSVEMLAMLLASVIQGQVVAVYNTEKQEACDNVDHNPETPQSTSSPQTASLRETEKAFLTSALVMGALFFLSSMVLFLGVKEQRAPLSSDDKVRPSYLASLKMLVCHIPYQRLVLGFVFSILAFQMSLGNFALFCSHAAGLGAHFQHLLLILLGSASIAVPHWQMVLLTVGKRTTVFIGLSLFIPAVIVIACVPSSLPAFMIMCVLIGFSVATLFLLPWSMLPDVVDDFAVKHPSCKDLEPLFFSCYAFCSKLAGGLAVGISTLTLQFVGYRAGACEHGEGVVTALIVLFSPVPIALLLIGMVFFWSYPIKERQQDQLSTKSDIDFYIYADDTQIYVAISPVGYGSIDLLCYCLEQIEYRDPKTKGQVCQKLHPPHWAREETESSQQSLSSSQIPHSVTSVMIRNAQSSHLSVQMHQRASLESTAGLKLLSNQMKILDVISRHSAFTITQKRKR